MKLTISKENGRVELVVRDVNGLPKFATHYQRVEDGSYLSQLSELQVQALIELNQREEEPVKPKRKSKKTEE